MKFIIIRKQFLEVDMVTETLVVDKEFFVTRAEDFPQKCRNAVNLAAQFLFLSASAHLLIKPLFLLLTIQQILTFLLNLALIPLPGDELDVG